MVITDFTKNTGHTLLLGDNDPKPVEIINNPGNIILTGPHNGNAVPSCLPECMGTNPEWFFNAHEAMDLHMDKLFRTLQEGFKQVSFISGNYSRLVCDLNAMPDYAFTKHSPENNTIKIHHNEPDQCCSQQRLQRLDTLYWPYHDAKQALIDQKRQEYGGVIVLDMHSFTPTWEQKKRDVELGTIRSEKTPFSKILEAYLKGQSDYLFISGEPYRVAERPSNAAPMITEKSDLQYLGLEIRNDLLETDEGISKMHNFLQKTLYYLLEHPDIDQAMKKRNDVIQPQKEDQDIYASWSI